MEVLQFSLDQHPSTSRLRLKSVLAVDRDRLWGRSVRDALEEGGYHVHWVQVADEARRRLRDRAYDLVLLSRSIGRLAVVSLMAELRLRQSPPPVLLVASVREGEHWQPWHFLPVVSILHRPYTVEDVADAAAALLGHPWRDEGDSA
jgi:DNA-binding response OmpR family regulator